MKKILIVEDEVLIAQSLKKLLERRGHQVQLTESGHEAIRLIHENVFDRIVCDLMLQDISGFDILEEVKRELGSEGIEQKFIIITAYSSPQVLQKAREYGCTVLTKPFEDLMGAIFMMEGGS